MKHNFKNLQIWQKSRVLVKSIYTQTQKFPSEEKFGLTSQMRRSAVSIPSNIAEGCGRNTDNDIIRFMRIAIGSACELETQIYLSFDLEYFSEEKTKYLLQEINEIRKMIMSFIKKINTQNNF